MSSSPAGSGPRASSRACTPTTSSRSAAWSRTSTGSTATSTRSPAASPSRTSRSKTRSASCARFLNREGPRISEAARLQVQDVDLDRGALRLEKNTTNDPRAWALSSGVAPALRAWQALRGNPAPSAPLFVNEDGDRFSIEHAAERFRAHLQLAGIDRPELFEDSDERQQVRAHDTRSTFITVALANGRSETWVADRTGHRAPSCSEGVAGRPGRLQSWASAS
ncbi:tyrosine-type recombinase/integrase [Sorangium sp. So ce406]|uniref:tyrosine-type recombinase/integrase n=1 Tax=Sorangium sp. So ce406 TaxID=3133311 RepID=UPI003F5BB892